MAFLLHTSNIQLLLILVSIFHITILIKNLIQKIGCAIKLSLMDELENLKLVKTLQHSKPYV